VISEAQKFKSVTHKVQSLAEENRKSFQEKCSCDVFFCSLSLSLSLCVSLFPRFQQSLSQKSCFPQLGKRFCCLSTTVLRLRKSSSRWIFSFQQKIAPIYSERRGKAQHEKHRAVRKSSRPCASFPIRHPTVNTYVPQSKNHTVCPCRILPKTCNIRIRHTRSRCECGSCSFNEILPGSAGS